MSEHHSKNDRYSRQRILPHVGDEGQERLGASTVAIVGVGALGSVAAELLCRAGVGRLLLIDFDLVELSNLQRQSLYEEKDVGTPKATAAAAHLARINGDVEARAFVAQLNPTTASLLDEADVLLDCTDNLQARHLLNEYSMRRKVPFVYCGAVETRAMLYVVDPTRAGRACFSCVFERLRAFESCEDAGVLGVTTHLAATLQAAEALKLLLVQPYTDGLISADAWDLRVETFAVKRNTACPVCAGTYDRLAGKAPSVEFCVTKRCVKARPNAHVSLDLAALATAPGVHVLERHGEHGLRIALDGATVLVTPHGGLEFTSVKDQDLAKRLTERIYALAKKA